MRKFLAFMLVGLLFAGTAAACSSDDDGDSGDTTETTAATDSGDSGDSGGSGNADISAYCDSVQELADALEALRSDPTDSDAQSTVTELGQELASQSAELATQASSFTPEDLETFEQCQTTFNDSQG
ncbi:MAG: hypothetical protein H6518_07670 [Microthrixaceae bacterium]|nr:hypothetical protein [Microthrixaceae bacterium]